MFVFLQGHSKMTSLNSREQQRKGIRSRAHICKSGSAGISTPLVWGKCFSPLDIGLTLRSVHNKSKRSIQIDEIRQLFNIEIDYGNNT